MKKLLASVLVVISCTLGISASVLAATPPAPTPGVSTVPTDSCHHGLLGIPRWYDYLDLGNKNGDPCAIVGPGHTKTGDPCKPTDSSGCEFDWGRALPRVALAVVNILLRVAGLIAVGFTIYGGFRYILSQGEPEATKKAKGTIISASVGLVITMSASLAVGFVGGLLLG